MLLLDTSFLIEFEDELANRKTGPARAVLTSHRRQAVAISIITLGQFAQAFEDSMALVEFLAPFRVVQLSRAIGAWPRFKVRSAADWAKTTRGSPQPPYRTRRPWSPAKG